MHLGRHLKIFLSLAAALLATDQSAAALRQEVLNIATRELPTAAPGERYAYRLRAVGGKRPYNFSFSGRAPLRGIRLAKNGNLTGTPKVDFADVPFRVRVTDAKGKRASKRLFFGVDMLAMTLPFEVETSDVSPGGEEVTKFVFTFLGNFRPRLEFNSLRREGPIIPSSLGLISLDGQAFSWQVSKIVMPHEQITLFAKGWGQLLYVHATCSSFATECT